MADSSNLVNITATPSHGYGIVLQGHQLGHSLPGAVVACVLFGLLGILSTYNFFHTKHISAAEGALGAYMRAVSLGIRAATISKGTSTTGQAFCHLFFQGAGYSISVGVQALITAGWLLNTIPKHKMALWRPLRMLNIVLFPIVLVFGPFVNIAAGVLIFNVQSDGAIRHGLRLREASSLGIFLVACLGAISILMCVYTALATTGWPIRLRHHPHNLILFLVPSALLLMWSGLYRVVNVFDKPSLAATEDLLYPLQMVPELLQMCMWASPTLFARIEQSSHFKEWWRAKHPREKVPHFGFPELLHHTHAGSEMDLARKATSGTLSQSSTMSQTKKEGVDLVVDVEQGGQ